jgi:hypothetical protein
MRASLATEVPRYQWNSAAIHLGAPDPWDLLAIEDWSKCWSPEQWRSVLAERTGEAAAIRGKNRDRRIFLRFPENCPPSAH